MSDTDDTQEAPEPKAAKRQKDVLRMRREALAAFISTPGGRAVMAHWIFALSGLIDIRGSHDNAFSHFNQGARSIGRAMLDDCHAAAPASAVQMYKETMFPVGEKQ